MPRRRARRLPRPATVTGRLAITAAVVLAGWVAGVLLAGGGPAQMLAWLAGYWGVPLLGGALVYAALSRRADAPRQHQGPRDGRHGGRPTGTLGGVPGGGPPTWPRGGAGR